MINKQLWSTNHRMDPEKIKLTERLDQLDWDCDMFIYARRLTAAVTDGPVVQALDFPLKEMEQWGYNEAQIELMRNHWGAIMDGDRKILNQIALLGE
jgi:hypothetical protein